MEQVRMVSLDVTGTLVDGGSVKHFWDRLIPAAYAAENNISFQEAFSHVERRYSMISPDDIRWYLPEYWLRELNISMSFERLLEELRPKIIFFPDVEPVITRLSSACFLIVSSNLPSRLLHFILDDFKDCFSKVFSSVSTYSLPHKTAEFYAKVCSETGFSPHEVLHVGDNRIYDLLIPRIIGMKSLMIRRYSDPKQDCEVNGLEQVLDRVLA
ncbi:MAG: HAD family hydrolase, partial [Thermoproteota archaeon]